MTPTILDRSGAAHLVALVALALLLAAHLVERITSPDRRGPATPGRPPTSLAPDRLRMNARRPPAGARKARRMADRGY